MSRCRALLLAALAVLCAPAQATESPTIVAPYLDTELVRLFESLPVQDGGRIKPLRAFAEVSLLRLSGKRSLSTVDGESLGASAWLLRTLLFPERAARDGLFLVENAEVLTALGLDSPFGAGRGRVRWELLEPAIPRLMDRAHEASRVESAERSVVQRQLISLAGSANLFLQLTQPLDRQRALALFPPEPEAVGAEAWLSSADLLARAAESGELPADFEVPLEAWWSLRELAQQPFALAEALRVLGEHTRAAMLRRGEGARLDLELAFRRARLLDWSQAAFLLGFLATAVLWLRARGRWLARFAWGATAAGAGLLSAAIVWRCLIRGRPPVSTLYETIVFVTATGALLALVLELMTRRRLGLSAAAVIGTLGVYIANGYELLDRQDTMPSLIAVLDTNFWLATHVTAITLGYSAGLLAALLGNGLLIARMLRGRGAHERELERMIYGTLAFGVVFSTVGTILGGVWANDSWGRFWGWDPKENGALLIVISQVAILHGRKAGRLRAFGTAWCAAFGGTVIAFSWWGVNLLGVGLHSYGFTSGIQSALWTYYLIQWGLCVSAFFVARQREATQVGRALTEGESRSAGEGRDAGESGRSSERRIHRVVSGRLAR